MRITRTLRREIERYRPLTWLERLILFLTGNHPRQIHCRRLWNSQDEWWR